MMAAGHSTPMSTYLWLAVGHSMLPEGHPTPMNQVPQVHQLAPLAAEEVYLEPPLPHSLLADGHSTPMSVTYSKLAVGHWTLANGHYLCGFVGSVARRELTLR